MPVNNIPITVSGIDACPTLLDGVKQLWRINSKYLGMFPEGAFDEYAKRVWILVASDQQLSDCLGYLLYRITSRHVAIAHLCVRKDVRGRGVANKLFHQLANQTQNESGISVRCRKDYPANRLWPKLGFVPDGQLEGRGRDKSILERWWYKQTHATLFSEAAKQLASEKISAVMDANVLFDQERAGITRAEPSQALLADWLQESLELFVTDEIYIEIDRRDDQSLVRESRDLADKFKCLPCDSKAFIHWQNKLSSYFPISMTKQDESDLRQVARAVGGGAQFMLTRDEGLLHIASDILDETGLSILHPADLITRLDEISQESKYQPARYLGSSIVECAIRSSDADELATAMVMTDQGEKKKLFKSQLLSYISQPNKYDCRIIIANSSPTGCIIWSIDSGDPHTMVIHLLRNTSGSSSSTIIRQLIKQIVRVASQERVVLITLKDSYLHSNTESALYESGFVQSPSFWLKLNLYGSLKRAEAAAQIIELDKCPELHGQGAIEWATMIESLDPNSTEDIRADERRLWPVKLSDVNIPCYIVPIQPHWAAELFDDVLASQALFNRRDDLAMNTEAVYYRSARGISMQVPARILWYVSDVEHLGGVKSIRACSYLDEVVIGTPKELYRKFKRLGVFEWQQVFEIAGGNTSTKIMAIRFSQTQLLHSPVPFDRVQSLLDKPNQFQGPVQITPEVFVKIYVEGSR